MPRLPAIPKPREEARALSVRSMAYQLIREHKLPDVMIGYRRLIPVDAAEALLTPKS